MALALFLSKVEAYDCTALNLKIFVSDEPYSPDFAADYCYRQSENATLVSPDDYVLDQCVYNALIETDEFKNNNPNMARGLLGGKSVEGAPYQWLNGDLIGSGGSDYDNWKAHFTNLPNDECMVATVATQPGTAGPDFDADYGWYTVDCSIPQRVLCKDCADDYYYMYNCYKMCENYAPYDFWTVTCENQLYETNNFNMTDIDEEELVQALKHTAWQDANSINMKKSLSIKTETLGNGTETDQPDWFCKFGNVDGTCFQFPQDYAISRNGTINFSKNEIMTTNEFSFAGVDPLQFKYLDMSWNQILNLEEKTLWNYNQLVRINFMHNNISEILPNTFKYNRNLDILSLGHNQFDSVPINVFENTNMEVLDLSYNLLNTIPGNCFAPLKLKTVLMNNNDLPGLPTAQSMFGAAAQYLEKWDLSHNNIPYLYNGTGVVNNDYQFQGMENLKELNLSHNQIGKKDGREDPDGYAITAKTFYSTTWLYLEVIDLSYNQIDSIENQAWNRIYYNSMKSLDLSHNLITYMNSQMFYAYSNYGLNSLQTLKINNNKITYFPNDLFTYVPKLRLLDMSNNKASTLEDTIFSSLTELRYLNLEGNKFYYLNSVLLDGLNDLVFVNMNGNECIPEPNQCDGSDAAPTVVLSQCHCN